MEALGIVITRSDDVEVEAKCPGHFFIVGHEDRHPSWSVNLETGTHFCFSCGYNGSFTGLVFDHLSGFYALGEDDGHGDDKVTWGDARQWVEDQGVDLGDVEELPEFRSRPKRRIENPVVPERYLEEFSIEIPLRALEARGFPIRPQISLDHSMAAMRAYGIRFHRGSRSFILPIRDARTGDLWGWQYKPVDRNRRPHNWPERDRDQRVVLKKSHTLFGLDRMPRGAIPVLVEAPLDCARIWLDYKGRTYFGVASFGAMVSDRQMRLLQEVSDEVIMALDNDAEGKAQHERLLNSWGSRINMSFLNYHIGPYAKDPGEMGSEPLAYALEERIHSTMYAVI